MLTRPHCRQPYPGDFRLSRAKTTVRHQSCDEWRPRTPACQTKPKMFSMKNLWFSIMDYLKCDQMKTQTCFLKDIRSWSSDTRFLSIFAKNSNVLSRRCPALQWFIDVNTWQPTTLSFKLVFQLENFWIRICQVGKSLLFVGNPGCDFIGGCGCQDEASQTQLEVDPWMKNFMFSQTYFWLFLTLHSFQTLVSSNKNTSIDSPDIMTQYKQSKKGNCK